MTADDLGDNGPHLTAREQQVVAGRARGLSRQEIAQRLGVSPKTVKSHLARISKRLDIHDEAGIVGTAYRHGYLQGLPVERRTIRALTSRQLEVLERIAAGKSNQEIADELFLAVDTVKSRLRRVYDQLGARNREHAVALAYQHRLLTIPTQHDRSAAA